MLMLLSLTLHSCVSGAGGLKAYVDSVDGYEFLYPNGWLPVKVSNGPDVVFRDLIEETENVSVVVSPVASKKRLVDLGSPSEVGQRLAQKVLTPLGREAELVSAEAHQSGTKDYYILEYAINLSGRKRHNLVSVAVSRGKLFTLSVSTSEQRWSRVQNILEEVVNSFSVY
jgi:photosystem II oxygen-evolving enhancer protein 2